ncbi:MAG: hypothetical protein GY696_31410 [Gammaproteobacteria bacterium]|nr:hypothetical protein [Gammaproteobacteria bacterium]
MAGRFSSPASFGGQHGGLSCTALFQCRRLPPRGGYEVRLPGHALQP